MRQIGVKYWLSVVVGVMLVAICYGQNRSTMVFRESIYDFGVIKEVGGVVKHVFEFENQGKVPFVIESVSASCGCTNPVYSKAPIRPGAKGKIEVFFDPENRPGEFLKDITITSNGRKNRNTIQIKGTVVPRPRTVEDDYPMELTSGVRITTLDLSFRYIARGKSSSMSVGIVNASAKSVVVAAVSQPQTAYLKLSDIGELCAGCRKELTVTYDFSDAAQWGMYSDKIYFTVNGVRYNVPVSTTAICVDNFEALGQTFKDNAPKALFSSQYHNFGDVGRGETLTKEFTIENDGDLPLVLRNIKADNGVSVSLKAGTTIEPGKQVALVVKMIASSKPDRMRKSITIILNDPIRPMRELRIAAAVKE